MPSSPMPPSPYPPSMPSSPMPPSPMPPPLPIYPPFSPVCEQFNIQITSLECDPLILNQTQINATIQELENSTHFSDMVQANYISRVFYNVFNCSDIFFVGTFSSFSQAYLYINNLNTNKMNLPPIILPSSFKLSDSCKQ
jgi:hypothetical protein